MADAAAAAPVLGTSDPNAIPPDIAAVAPTGTPAAIPATVAAPAAGSDMPTPMGTTPGTELPATTDPEVAAGAVHQNWLSRILDTVGTILGGDKTIVATKHPDGTVSVEHNPSTTGEKWGRIAQAALGGAARGMAAGQGPGGAGKAFAAGAEAGLSSQQQALDQANKNAAALNAQQLAKANHALLDLSIARNQYENQEMPVEFRQKTALNSLAIADTLHKMGGTMIHHSQNAQDAAVFGNSNPLAVQGHVNGELMPIPNADGSIDYWQIPADAANQIVKDDVTYTEQNLDPHNLGKLVEKTVTIPGGTKTGGQVTLTLKGVTAQNNKNVGTAWTAQTAAQTAGNKEETNPLALQVQINQTTDPVKRQQLQAALDADQTRRETIARESRPVTAPLYSPTGGGQATTTPSGAPVVGTQWGGGDPNSAFERVSRMLQTGDMALSQVKAIRGKGNPTQQDYIGRADQLDREAGGTGLSPATQEARYKARTQTTEAYTGSGAAAQRIQGFSTLLEHLGDMSDNADELRRTNSPYLNRPINDLDRSIAGGTRVGPAELRTSAPAHEFANVLSNNRALNNDEKSAAAQSLNVNMTPAQLQANGKQMARTAIERLAPIMQAHREATNGAESPTQLTPRAIQTLRNMGLYDYAMRELHGTPTANTQANPPANNAPAANAAPTKNVVPAGATPGRDPATGKVIGYRTPDGTVVRF